MFVYPKNIIIIFTGDVVGNSTEFGSYSMLNLNPESNYLWAHISVGFILFPLSILIMRRFSQNVQFTQFGLEMNRTVLVENVPKSCCHGVEKIQRYIGVCVNMIVVQSISDSNYVLLLMIIMLEIITIGSFP